MKLILKKMLSQFNNNRYLLYKIQSFDKIIDGFFKDLLSLKNKDSIIQKNEDF